MSGIKWRLTPAIMVPFLAYPDAERYAEKRRSSNGRSARRSKKRGRMPAFPDIGTGSGLLSIICGARRARNIVTCERVPVIAEAAKRIIALNGYEQQIRVVSKSSSQIIVGTKLKRARTFLFRRRCRATFCRGCPEHIRRCMRDCCVGSDGDSARGNRHGVPGGE